MPPSPAAPTRTGGLSAAGCRQKGGGAGLRETGLDLACPGSQWAEYFKQSGLDVTSRDQVQHGRVTGSRRARQVGPCLPIFPRTIEDTSSSWIRPSGNRNSRGLHQPRGPRQILMSPPLSSLRHRRPHRHRSHVDPLGMARAQAVLSRTCGPTREVAEPWRAPRSADFTKVTPGFKGRDQWRLRSR